VLPNPHIYIYELRSMAPNTLAPILHHDRGHPFDAFDGDLEGERRSGGLFNIKLCD